MGRQGDIVLPRGAERALAEEVPVALVYNGVTQAVMMATPADLEDFAHGFTLTEGLARPGAIEEVEVVAHGPGLELRMWLDPASAAGLAARRRALAGPVGCGLCGIESLEQAVPAPAAVGTDALRIAPGRLSRLLPQMQARQPLHDATGAAHAAGLWRPGEGFVAVREDVGRHNALDKPAGALARRGETGAGAAVVLTSRVSVEMVQKAAALGAEAICAVSAPTALAVRVAEEAGLTLIANLKAGPPRALTHPHRLSGA